MAAPSGGGGGLLHLHDFFPPAGAERAAAPPLSTVPMHCLLCGPDRSGKTSLLFQLAHNLAGEGASVLIMGRRRRLEEAPPLLGRGVAPADAPWRQVRMKYVESGDDVMRYASLLHLSSAPPSVILLDDLDQLPVGGAADAGGRVKTRQEALCQLLAVLCDSLVRKQCSLPVAACIQPSSQPPPSTLTSRDDGAQEYVGRRLQRPTLLLVAEGCPSAGEPPRSLYLLQRWLPLVLGTRAAGVEGRFRLGALAAAAGAAAAAAAGPVPVGWQAEFSMGQGGMALEAVVPPQM
jgi:hypothetical protein